LKIDFFFVEKEMMKDFFTPPQTNKFIKNRINFAMKSLASDEIFAHRDPILNY